MRPLNLALCVAIFAAIAAFAVILLQPSGGAWLSRIAPKPAEPTEISFRDAVLDAKTLAARQAFVRVRGLYSAIGNLFYGPDHKATAAGGSVTLITDGAPRDVRAYLLECAGKPSGKPSDYYCPVWLTGHFGMCFLKISKDVTFPCLNVERVDPDR